MKARPGSAPCRQSCDASARRTRLRNLHGPVASRDLNCLGGGVDQTSVENVAHDAGNLTTLPRPPSAHFQPYNFVGPDVGPSERLQPKRLRIKPNFCLNGGAEGDRTPDLRNAIATLSQLSYGPAPFAPPSARGAMTYPPDGCRRR